MDDKATNTARHITEPNLPRWQEACTRRCLRKTPRAWKDPAAVPPMPSGRIQDPRITAEDCKRCDHWINKKQRRATQTWAFVLNYAALFCGNYFRSFTLCFQTNIKVTRNTSNHMTWWVTRRPRPLRHERTGSCWGRSWGLQLGELASGLILPFQCYSGRTAIQTV